MSTPRKPLPRGSIEEIDNALMEISDCIRVCLIMGRKPEADGRLTEVVSHLYEATSFLSKAKATAKNRFETVPDPITDAAVESCEGKENA